METIVIDSNFGIALVWPLPYSLACKKSLQSWMKPGISIFVPALWDYEVCSTLRKLWSQNLIARDLALEGLNFLYGLPIQHVQSEKGLAREALVWADRIGQIAAYDAQYLALAEKLKATFWTADQRLFERCQKSDARFVQMVA